MRIFYDRHDQSRFQRNRDSHVDRTLVNDSIARHGAVHDRELPDRIHQSLHKEGRIGQLDFLPVFERLFMLFPELDDVGHVHLEDCAHMSGGALTEHHVLGNCLSHRRHRHDFRVFGELRDFHCGSGSCGLGAGCCCLLFRAWDGSSHRLRHGSGFTRLVYMTQYVLLGNAAAQARALKVGQVDVVFSSQAPHQRRGADFQWCVRKFRNCFGLRRCGLRLRARLELLYRSLLLDRLGLLFDRSGLFHRSFSDLSLRRRRGFCLFNFGLRSVSVDDRNHSVDLHCLAFWDENLSQNPGGRRRNLRIHLVGRNLEQRLVPAHPVAYPFQPLGNGPFEYGFPHLGHDYFCGHEIVSLLMNFTLRKA